VQENPDSDGKPITGPTFDEVSAWMWVYDDKYDGLFDRTVNSNLDAYKLAQPPYKLLEQAEFTADQPVRAIKATLEGAEKNVKQCWCCTFSTAAGSARIR